MASAELAAILRAKNEAKAELDDFRNGLSGVERSFMSIPAAATAARVGIGATVAAAVAGTKAAYELGEAFDDAFDTIQIKSGATGQALEELKQDFREVVASVPTDFKAAGDAIGLLATRTGQTGVDLQKLTAQFLDLSRITGTDVSENVRSVTRLFGDWSVATEKQEDTLNKLFRAAQLSGTSVSELSQRVVQFGAPMRQLGIDLDEAVALFAKWEKEGVNVETVAGTMRMALAKLAESGVDPKEAFRGLVQIIHDMPDELAATNIAMDLFGKRGGADMAAAIREGRFAIDEMKASINEAGDTIGETARKTDDAKQQMQLALQQIALAFEPVGTAVFQLAADVATKFAEIVTTVRKALQDLRAEGQQAPTVTTSDVGAILSTLPPTAGAAAYMAGLEKNDLAAPDPAAAARAAAEAADIRSRAAAEQYLAGLREIEEKKALTAALREAEQERQKLEREAAAAVREAEREIERARKQAEREAEAEARRIEQLRELGERRTRTIIEATQAAQEAIETAGQKREEAIAKAETDFERERALAQKREQLQRDISAGIERQQAVQGGRRLGTQQLRELEDFDTRRQREDQDLISRRQRASREEQSSTEAINAVRFRGNSLEILAALKAADTRKQAITDQQAEEDRAFALRRQREDEDRSRRMERQADDIIQAKRDIDEINALRAELSKPLEELNRKILEDTLADKISGYYRAEQDAISAANRRLGQAEENADFTFNEGSRRLGGAQIIQNINIYNSGVMGEDAIQQLSEQTFDDAENMLRTVG